MGTEESEQFFDNSYNCPGDCTRAKTKHREYIKELSFSEDNLKLYRQVTEIDGEPFGLAYFNTQCNESEQNSSFIRVMIVGPGQMPSTRIPFLANSTAAIFVRPMTPCCQGIIDLFKTTFCSNYVGKGIFCLFVLDKLERLV